MMRSPGPYLSGAYRRYPRLILVNGLAEQPESWYETRHVWQQCFDVHMPALLVYDGPVMQQRLKAKQAVSVDFFVERLHTYLDQFVQSPPYCLAGSSLGGQIVVEYAVQHPENVAKIALLCPSGMGTAENLPVLDSFRHNDFLGLVASTFADRARVNPDVVEQYRTKFASREWRRAFFETVRGTKNHSVADRLLQIDKPALVICGEADAIVDSQHVKKTVSHLPSFRFEMIPACGHAPQLECPEIVNSLICDFFLSDDSHESVSGLATA